MYFFAVVQTTRAPYQRLPEGGLILALDVDRCESLQAAGLVAHVGQRIVVLAPHTLHFFWFVKKLQVPLSSRNHHGAS